MITKFTTFENYGANMIPRTDKEKMIQDFKSTKGYLVK